MNSAESKKYREIREDCGDDNLAMKLWLRWKCLTDLYFLGAEIFGLGNGVGPNKRKRLDPRVHRELAKDLEGDEDWLILYPRLHMKTTWAKYAIIQCILKDPNVRVGLWAKTASLVRNELKGIKHLLARPHLRELFPDIIPERKKWEKDTTDSLTMFREDSEFVPDEDQVEVWGVDSGVTGRHYDRHFYDDVIDKDTVNTSDQIEKTRIWWQHLQAVKEPTAVEKMTGTRYHEHDIYGEIIREGYFGKHVTVKKALVGNKPYYAYYTKKALDKLRRRMGERVFSTQFMNEPVPPQDRLFTLPAPVWTELPDDPVYYMTVDPSLGKKYGDSAGICVACISDKRHDRVYFTEAYKVKMKSDKLAEHIVDKIYQHRPRRVGIEYGLQEGLRFLIDRVLTEKAEKARERFRPMFVPISTGRTPKPVKIDRTIGSFYRQGRALFKPEMTDLFQQMAFFNPHSDANDDDILDAAGMMIQTIEYFAQAQWFTEEEVPFVWVPKWPTRDEIFKKPEETIAWDYKFAN
ncbi:MAG: hypothetical protein ABIJ57_10870 [Pseudomonadota bacterium]